MLTFDTGLILVAVLFVLVLSWMAICEWSDDHCSTCGRAMFTDVTRGSWCDWCNKHDVV